MLLIVDNYDSFTYTLLQYVEAQHLDTKVIQNDTHTIDEIKAMAPAGILISPGPGHPDDSGICAEVVNTFAPHVPILGVCLGHQVMAQCFGGGVKHADVIFHGKTSVIDHDNTGCFKDLPQRLRVCRYHSLVVDPATLPECLVMNAWVANESGDPIIMGFRHTDYPLHGVQFHPEAILTESGHGLLHNFLQECVRH